MGEHSRSRTTTAGPDRVWEIWADTSTWASWNPDVASMEPGSRLATGRQVTMHTNDGRHHLMTVVDLEPGRRFALETSPVPLATFRFTCSVEPAATGSTISQGVAMRGPMGWLMSVMAGDRIADGFSGVLDGLAHAAEAP